MEGERERDQHKDGFEITQILFNGETQIPLEWSTRPAPFRWMLPHGQPTRPVRMNIHVPFVFGPHFAKQFSVPPAITNNHRNESKHGEGTLKNEEKKDERNTLFENKNHAKKTNEKKKRAKGREKKRFSVIITHSFVWPRPQTTKKKNKEHFWFWM